MTTCKHHEAIVACGARNKTDLKDHKRTFWIVIGGICAFIVLLFTISATGIAESRTDANSAIEKYHSIDLRLSNIETALNIDKK